MCKLHHDNFGRRLTRAAVTTALQGTGTKSEKMIRFGAGNETLSDVEGQVIKVVIPDTSEVAEIFLTDEHAAYWLSHGKPPADPVGSA